jgi:hypothetical protein
MAAGVTPVAQHEALRVHLPRRNPQHVQPPHDVVMPVRAREGEHRLANANGRRFDGKRGAGHGVQRFRKPALRMVCRAFGNSP